MLSIWGMTKNAMPHNTFSTPLNRPHPHIGTPQPCAFTDAKISNTPNATKHTPTSHGTTAENASGCSKKIRPSSTSMMA